MWLIKCISGGWFFFSFCFIFANISILIKFTIPVNFAVCTMKRENRWQSETVDSTKCRRKWVAQTKRGLWSWSEVTKNHANLTGRLFEMNDKSRRQITYTQNTIMQWKPTNRLKCHAILRSRRFQFLWVIDISWNKLQPYQWRITM